MSKYNDYRDRLVVDQLNVVAWLFGVRLATPRDWIQRGMPVEDHDDGSRSYDLAEINRWIQDQRAAEPKSEKQDLEIEKLRIDVERKRLDLQAEAGQLVNRAAAKQAVESMFHRVRSRLEALPGELASSVPSDQRGEYLADSQSKVKLVLKEMENWQQPEE